VTAAEPLNTYALPEPSIWPFVSAVVTSAIFLGSIFTAWAFVAGALPIAVALVGWFWPKRSEATTEDARKEAAAA